MRRNAGVRMRKFNGRYRFKKPKNAVGGASVKARFEEPKTDPDNYGMDAFRYALMGMVHEDIVVDKSRLAPAILEAMKGDYAFAKFRG